MTFHIIRALRRAAFFPLMSMALACNAANLSIHVADPAGRALTDAVVYAEPASGPVALKTPKTVEIEQKGRKFLPLVTVIQVGTSISFPNNDTVRHHVYSLSPAKVFDLKLYSGKPENPVNFDKAGNVVIGCNIHDQMIAYIHVVATPYFTKTDAGGNAKLEGLPAGKYMLKSWHYGLPVGVPVPEQPLDMSSADLSVNITLNAKVK